MPSCLDWDFLVFIITGFLVGASTFWQEKTEAHEPPVPGKNHTWPLWKGNSGLEPEHITLLTDLYVSDGFLISQWNIVEHIFGTVIFLSKHTSKKHLEHK